MSSTAGFRCLCPEPNEHRTAEGHLVCAGCGKVLTYMAKSFKVGDDWHPAFRQLEVDTFIEGIGTVRSGLDCSCLIAGGPTRCIRCVREGPPTRRNRWKSADDPPEKVGYYLAVWRTEDSRQTGEAWFDGEEWVWPIYGDEKGMVGMKEPEVTHWRELPEVPGE